MIESVGLSVGINLLVKSAPHWFPPLRDKLFSTGEDALLKKGKERALAFLDEKKHLRHMELALQNAAERGARQWHTREERTCYNGILHILSEGHNESLR